MKNKQQVPGPAPKCAHCGGSGRVEAKGTRRRCPKCNGSGVSGIRTK